MTLKSEILATGITPNVGDYFVWDGEKLHHLDVGVENNRLRMVITKMEKELTWLKILGEHVQNTSNHALSFLEKKP